MSQPPMPYPPSPPPYPGPYAAAGYGYGPPAGGTSPAGRRAGVMLFVTGGLMLALGACNTLQAITRSSADLARQMQDQQSSMGQPSLPLSAGAIRAFLLVVSGGILGVGLTSVLLGTGVRRGSRPATVAALVLSGLLLAGSALFVLASAVSGFMAPVVWAFTCVMLVPTVAMTLQVTWLIRALRAPPGGGDPSYQQYVAQWYQYQQAAQAYAMAAGGGGDYGYAAAPPAGPPEPPASAM